MAEIKEKQNKSTKNVTFGNVPLSDVFFMTLRHWYWILLSMVICVGVAYLYILRTPAIYTRSAEILIKNDSKSRSTDEEFADFGVFKSKSNIDNEIKNLKAKDLMEEVVRRMNLDYNYYRKGTFHDNVAFGLDLPIKLTVENFSEENSFSLDLTVKKDGEVIITDFVIDETKGHTYKGKLNQPINTQIGKILITPTNNYVKGQEINLIVKKVPLSAARDSYNARLNASLSTEKGSIILLTLSDASIQRADEVLTTLITVYNENWIKDKNQIAVSTSNFINDRLGVIEGELGNVDSDISSYKSANLIPDVEAAASMYMSQSQQTKAQILEVNNQLSMARYIRSYLSDNNNHNQLLPANSGLQNANVQTLISEYNDKLMQRNALEAKSSEKNPLVNQLNDQLAAQKHAVIRSVDNEILALNTQLKSLMGSEAQTMSKIASNPTQAKNLLSTERQQKVKESLYLFLLQKREENELSQAFTAYNTRIVNKPGASDIPPTPNRRKILAFAFLIGLAIPFGVTYVKETTNTKVRGRKDVEHLPIPFLGEIPLYESKSSKDKKEDSSHEIIVKAGKRNIINEAFRVLRTNVEFMCNSTDGSSVISLTSFNPRSGKSFISINLGMSVAIKGKKVLVIDGDMRHGSVSAYIDSPDKGLSGYLSGNETNLESLIIQEPNCPTLSILPIGVIPPNPTELLETPLFGKMIQDLRREYDLIIIDCPPIEVVADAQIIDKLVDRTFFVIRAGLFERSMLPVFERIYDEKKYTNIAFILNGTNNESSRYGYSHSYRYGYGYGYGYGYEYSSENKKKRK